MVPPAPSDLAAPLRRRAPMPNDAAEAVAAAAKAPKGGNSSINKRG
ncbi:hypothetical protein [Bacillus phage BM-P1]|nr:hypothetical protein [Bacillus phage BM-P1]